MSQLMTWRCQCGAKWNGEENAYMSSNDFCHACHMEVKSVPAKHVYSMRAECLHDFHAFRTACRENGVNFNAMVFLDKKYPDVEIEIKSMASYQQIQDAIRNVPDGHVMLQTMQPFFIKDNKLERDYSLF